MRKIILYLLVGLLCLIPTAAPTLEAAPTGAETLSVESFSCTTVTDIPQAECETLVIIYNSTNGTGWTNSSGWLSSSTACSWFGISCSDGHVIRLQLYQNNLSGSIPPQIGNLNRLKSFHMGGNQLSGSVPTELGELLELQDIYLFGNQLIHWGANKWADW